MTRSPSLAPNTQYLEAYHAHYSEQDLPKALNKYLGLIESYPGSVESQYATTQIQNMVRTEIPFDEQLAALVCLLQGQFESQQR